MKILAICNNHNSLALLDLSQKIADFYPKIEIVAVCEQRLASDIEAKLKNSIKSELIIWSMDVSNEQLANLISIKYNIRNLFMKFYRYSIKAIKENRSNNGFLEIIKSSTHGQIFTEKYIKERIELAKKKAHEIIELEKPDVVFSISDRSHDYLESSLLWAAKQSNIKMTKMIKRKSQK
jgi:hypothetical protein